MTISIRDAVFETNSSSSHSVTVSRDDMIDTTFPPEMLKAGRIDVRLGRFGWEETEFTDPVDKLSYLLTQAKDDPGTTRRIVEAVEAHTGVVVVIDAASREDAYVDHQSQGEGMHVVDDPDLMMRFVLSSGATLRTGNDNVSSYDY